MLDPHGVGSGVQRAHAEPRGTSDAERGSRVPDMCGNIDNTKRAMFRGPPTFVGTVSLLGVLLATEGCAVGPDFKKPEVPVAASFRATSDPRIAAQAAADSLWWKEFKDPALDRLVELSFRQNLPLQIAGLRIAEARAELAVTSGKQWPQVQEAFANATAVGLSSAAATAFGIPRNFAHYQLGFDAAWEIDLWGKYSRGVDAAAASLLASVGDYYSAVVSLTAEVARTYVAVRTFEVLIQQAEENAKIQEEALEIAQSRFKNGAASELDPTQATTQLQSTRATIPRLQFSMQQARNALSTLLGQLPGSVDSLLTGPKDIPKAPEKVAVGVPSEMLRRRPDIRSAELYAAAQCARIGIAKSELYPSFSLVGTIGLQAVTASSGSQGLFSPHSIFYSVGPQLHLPIFNYGRLKNAVRVEDARFQQLLVSYRDTVIKAAQEAEDAMTGFRNTQEEMVFQQGAVTSAQRAVEIAMVQYREGATDFERVLDAQRVLLHEENSLAQTRSAVATNVIAVYKALGGGWEMRQDQPFVPDGTQKEMKERTDWGDMLSRQSKPEAAKNPPPGKR
jgi:NodT family efflux transporter outer membrane factor (OMF) lipoprotein